MSLYINRFYLLHQRLRRMKGWYKPAIAASANQEAYVEARSTERRPPPVTLYASCVTVLCLMLVSRQHAHARCILHGYWLQPVSPHAAYGHTKHRAEGRNLQSWQYSDLDLLSAVSELTARQWIDDRS